MHYLFIILYTVILPIIFIVFLWKILNAVEELEESVKQNQIESQKETKIIRKHKSIEKSNFDNAFGGRKAYEIYKNNNGLYEPVTPSKGMKIEKKEE